MTLRIRLPDCEGSNTDVTSVWESLVSSVDRWRILEDIAFEVIGAICQLASVQQSPCGWNVIEVHHERFVKSFGKDKVALGDMVALQLS